MPARDDPNPRIAAICLGIIAFIAAGLAVYFPRFSCFYELHGIEDHTIEMMGGIFGSCAVFSVICILLWLKWPHSKCITVFTQFMIVIFVLGTSLFGICVFSMMEVAAGQLDDNHKNNQGKNSTTSTSFITSAPIKAVETLLAPMTDLEALWTKIAEAQNVNNSFVLDNETVNKEASVCRLQKQFQCMMWRGSDTCVLDTSSSSSVDDYLLVGDSNATTAISSVTGTAPPSPSTTQPPCLTCGIFTMNVTETDRPVSCFSAIVDCFAHGRDKHATGGKYIADRYNMIIGSVVILVLGAWAFIKLMFREYVVPAGYGDYEHGIADDYKPLRSGLMYD